MLALSGYSHDSLLAWRDSAAIALWDLIANPMPYIHHENIMIVLNFSYHCSFPARSSIQRFCTVINTKILHGYEYKDPLWQAWGLVLIPNVCKANNRKGPTCSLHFIKIRQLLSSHNAHFHCLSEECTHCLCACVKQSSKPSSSIEFFRNLSVHMLVRPMTGKHLL